MKVDSFFWWLEERDRTEAHDRFIEAVLPWRNADYRWPIFLTAGQEEPEKPFPQTPPPAPSVLSDISALADKHAETCKELLEIIERQIAVQEAYCARIRG